MADDDERRLAVVKREENEERRELIEPEEDDDDRRYPNNHRGSRRRSNGSGNAPTVVIMNNSGSKEKSRKQREEPKKKIYEQGHRFADCIHCKNPVLWHPTPEAAVVPYRVCKNDCQGTHPKALHEQCAPAYCLSPENKDYRGITIVCEACGCTYDLDAIKSVTILVVRFLKSRVLWWFALFFLVFFAYGFVWKTWALYNIISHYEPVDIINNPSYIRFDAALNKSVIDRPVWAWYDWHDWTAYNHCVITEWGRRRLLSTFERRQRGRPLHSASLYKELTSAEMFGQLHSFIMDSSDDTFVDLSHYFSPCSDTGTIGFSWSWLFSHLYVCLWGLRWMIVMGTVFGLLLLFDLAIGRRLTRFIIKKSIVYQVTQGGRSKTVSETSKVAGQRRRVVR